MTDSLPPQGRLAGVDYGSVRIGVALCDPEQSFSVPAENYTRRGDTRDAAYFRDLAQQERLVGFVVGLPIHMTGDESQKSHEARQFGAWLQQATNVPVAFHDERLSSVLADDLMLEANVKRKARKKRRDALAAHIILSSFLESRRSQSERARRERQAEDKPPEDE